MFGFTPRAYDQVVDRINRRTSIVNSADDIRRAVTLCVSEQRPCVLEMGDNIGVDAGFTLPVGLKSFRIDGADRYRFIVTQDIPFLFHALGAQTRGAGFPVEISSVDVIVQNGATIDTVFFVEQAGGAEDAAEIAFGVRGVKLTGTDGAITNVFALADRVGSNGHIVVDGLTALEVGSFFKNQPSTSSWLFSSVKNVYMTGVGLANVDIGHGAASVSILSCLFEQVNGAITVDTGEFSDENLWTLIRSNSAGTFTTNDSVGNRPQTLLRVSNFASKTLSAGDKDLDL